MNFQTICRICTGENLGMVSIFEPYDFSAHNSEIFKVIIDCASVQIQKFDGFSEQICRSCLDQLSQAYRFKKLCEDSDYKFRNNLIASSETEIKYEFCEEETAIIYDGHIKKDEDGNNKITKVKEVQCDVEMETEKSFHEDQVEINQQDVNARSEYEFKICPKIDNADTSYKFVPAEEYLANMKAHAEQPPQMCEEVDYEFKDDSSDEFHDKSDFSDDDTEINYSETKFKPSNDEIVTKNKCDRGGEVIQNQVSCKSTDCNEQNGSLYKCEICSKSFTTNISLAHHKRILHMKTHKCDICEKTFPLRWHLMRHASLHTGEKPFECDICEKTYAQRKNLMRHASLHTEKPFKCDICEKTFTLRLSLMSHARLHTGEKPFKCDTCEKTFILRRHLMRHASLHTGEFKCDICEKTFTQRQTLIAHASVHTKEKPFKCNICEKTFTQKQTLMAHASVHTGEKPFKCDICEKTFTQRKNLIRHGYLHTGEKRFKCDICEKTFTQRRNLMSHTSVHMGEKPFKCDICGEAFRDKYLLRRHRKLLHLEGRQK